MLKILKLKELFLMLVLTLQTFFVLLVDKDFFLLLFYRSFIFLLSFYLIYINICIYISRLYCIVKRVLDGYINIQTNKIE